MSVVEELIRKEDNGTLSFGNYLLDTKTKKADFPFEGASYKIKTFNGDYTIGEERNYGI